MAFLFVPLRDSFQSTLSVRRATRLEGRPGDHRGISIHALRKESDLIPATIRTIPRNFNPRSP